MADSIIGAPGITANHVAAATHKIAAVAQSTEIVLGQVAECSSLEEARNIALAGMYLVQQLGYLADLLSERCCGLVTVGEGPEWMLPTAWHEGDAELARRQP